MLHKDNKINTFFAAVFSSHLTCKQTKKKKSGKALVRIIKAFIQ